MMNDAELRGLPGCIATVVLSGQIMPQFAGALSDMRSYNDRNGFHKVEYKTFYAVLVEAGRDETVQHMLKEGYEWMLQIDADAAPFPADALHRLLVNAFIRMPQADVIGGYCQIKGHVNVPTIDTGTGTWEEHYPGEGIIPVIRTGAHFLLTKRSAFQKSGPPWFRTRVSTTPLRAMMEVDNFARTSLDGNNPLRDCPEWETLLQAAYSKTYGETHVGEDSGFFDKLAATGGLAFVDTDLVVGHLTTKTIMPDDFKKAMRERLAAQRSAVGIYQ